MWYYSPDTTLSREKGSFAIKEGGEDMPKIIAIEIAKEKATMLMMTEGCDTAKEVAEKIERYYEVVARYAQEIDADKN
jgi:hypothetical protein